METTLLEYGESLMSSVIRTFWNPEGKFAREELADPPESETAFLWPFCCFIEMLSEYYKIDPSIKSLYITALDTIEKYRQTRDDDLTAYAALYGGYEDPYYDDNGWVVKVFLTAYKLLGEQKWLDKASDTVRYGYSGWDEKTGGGIYWRESDKLFKCLCSNAPLALLSIELYEKTSDKQYMEWTQKLYSWSKKNFWETDGIYIDGIFTDGKIDNTKYPYNTAFMMRLELELYKLTKEHTYLDSVEKSADSSYLYFLSPDEEGKLKLTDRPWFYMCLLEAYMELYKVSSHKVLLKSYIDWVVSEVIRAYQTCRNKDGFVSPDWWTEGGPAPENIQIRDQSAIARTMFLLAKFYNTNTKQRSVRK